MATERNNNDRRLQELGGSDFEIADGEQDIRGWDVKDVDGKRIGEVDDLIFDEVSRKVRYMKIDLEGNVLDLEPRDVLVPIGLAQLHDNDDDVILNNVTADQLRALPKYDADDLGTDFEGNIRRVFGGVGDAAITGAAATTGALTADRTDTNDRGTDFYNHEHFNDDNLYRNRRQNTGIEHQATGETFSDDLRQKADNTKNDIERGGIRLRNRINDAFSDNTSNSNNRNSDFDTDNTLTSGTTSSTNLDNDTLRNTDTNSDRLNNQSDNRRYDADNDRL